MTEPSSTPASCTWGLSNGCGFLGLFIAFFVSLYIPFSQVNQAVFILLSVTLPILIIEIVVYRVHRRSSTGLDWQIPIIFIKPRIIIKYIGFISTLLFVAFWYWLFPEYHGSFYDPFWEFLKDYGTWILILSPLYFAYVDARMREPKDAYWQLGCCLLGKWSEIDRSVVWNHLRGWIVKGFFLPLMFIYLTKNVHDAQQSLVDLRQFTFVRLYDFLWDFSMFVDVSFATAGYILTVRCIDAHLRSAEPTMFGWFVALMCYEPFWSTFSTGYIIYEDNLIWDAWLKEHWIIQVLWGSTIIMFISVYTWATVSFGCRFSNLTHRGIITNGPYKWTKHPAYISKNLSWWLISVPWLSSEGCDTAIRHCLSLLLLNMVYFLRAKTEERHLSRDAEYRQYADWIQCHGIFARFRRLFSLKSH